MYKRVIGIDPGVDGAVAIGDRTGVLFIELLRNVSCSFFPPHLTDNPSNTLVVLEKAQSMPGNGASAMFNYGTGFGRLMGWFEALGTPMILVPPKVWTAEMHKGCTGSTAKVKSHMAAKRLLPHLCFKKSHFARKDDHNLIDAALICEYGRRLYLK